MAMKRRPRAEAQSAEERAWLAAFLGDKCPEGFNQFIFFDYDGAARCPRLASTSVLAEAQATWGRLRPEVLREWARRKRKGSPPGCSLDRTVTK